MIQDRIRAIHIRGTAARGSAAILLQDSLIKVVKQPISPTLPPLLINILLAMATIMDTA